MKKPNLFIIGFPKCGTTSLARYLAEHPDILFSKVKEPHYFSFDFRSPVLRRVSNENDYLALFEGDRKDYKFVGEASTGYIYSKTAIDNILNFSDRPKFIVLIRNPVDMVLSEHAQMLRSGHEDIENFFEAWNLSDERICGYSLPRKKSENILVSYKHFGRIGTYLEHAIEKIGRESMYIIVFDDMVSDMRSVYKGVLGFLGVADDGRSDFPIFNDRRYHRFKLIKNFVNDPPRRLLYLSNTFKRMLGVESIGFVNWLREKNLQKKQINIPEWVINEVRSSFDDEIKKVSYLIGRDLGW